MTEPFELSATEAAVQIDAGSLTAEGLIASCIERIQEREADVLAWKHFDPEGALAQARELNRGGKRGPIHGLPFGVKDIIDTSTMPTGYGSPIYENHQPAIDAPCVALSLQSGGVLMGKTVSTEFASRHPGATRNPHNSAHTPGGSSSGSAAAVADLMVPFALGTQTSGSVIRPAAFCGCVGYKPTYGLIPAAGVKENTRSFDTVGLYARTLDDIALLRAGVLAIPHETLADCALRDLRIGFCRTMFWDRASAANKKILEAAAETLAHAGARVSDITLDGPFDGYEALGRTVTGFEFPRALTFERLHHLEMLSDELVENRLKAGLEVSFEAYQTALDQLVACRQWLADKYSDYDAILTPSATGEAPESLGYTGDPCFNILATWTHTPAVTLPTNTGPNGLPIGVQLVGQHRKDWRLLEIARAAFPVLSEALSCMDAYRCISAKILSTAVSAIAASSSGVRFWIGCGTQTSAGLKPSAFACALAPGLNSTEATAHPGMPRLSRVEMSCKLHDVHDPQSARPTMATSHVSTISWITVSGAGLV